MKYCSRSVSLDFKIFLPVCFMALLHYNTKCIIWSWKHRSDHSAHLFPQCTFMFVENVKSNETDLLQKGTNGECMNWMKHLLESGRSLIPKVFAHLSKLKPGLCTNSFLFNGRGCWWCARRVDPVWTCSLSVQLLYVILKRYFEGKVNASSVSFSVPAVHFTDVLVLWLGLFLSYSRKNISTFQILLLGFKGHLFCFVYSKVGQSGATILGHFGAVLTDTNITFGGSCAFFPHWSIFKPKPIN